jgi:protein-S-isoprenylcysteine O-methyltransferase Ste14
MDDAALLWAGCYFAGLAIASAVRGWYTRELRRQPVRGSPVDMVLLALSGTGMLLFPLVYVLTDWLACADYGLPAWSGIIGVLLFAAAILLLWRSHADLGANWTPVPGTVEGQRLVTSGVYRRIRHPMYAAHILWGAAETLLIQNFIAGWVMLVSAVLLYLFRSGPEEAMMEEEFGDRYREYRERTGRLLPRFR